MLVIRGHYLPSPEAPSSLVPALMLVAQSTRKEYTDVDVQHVAHAIGMRHVGVKMPVGLRVAVVGCRSLS